MKNSEKTPRKTIEFTITGATMLYSGESADSFRQKLMDALGTIDLKNIRIAITTPKAKKVKVWAGQPIKS